MDSDVISFHLNRIKSLGSFEPIDFAKLINSEIMILENNCGHLAIGCEMKKCADAINSFFRK